MSILLLAIILLNIYGGIAQEPTPNDPGCKLFIACTCIIIIRALLIIVTIQPRSGRLNVFFDTLVVYQCSPRDPSIVRTIQWGLTRESGIAYSAEEQSNLGMHKVHNNYFRA